MSAHDLLASAIPAVAALAVLGVAAEARASGDPRLRADLQGVARRTVFFGHQSVGMNLLDGIARIASREGVSLTVKDVTSSPMVAPGILSHAFEPENGKPEMKLLGFARHLEALSASPPDIALVKFCYVDFDAGTDVAALFARYQATLADLRARSPGTTFVHVTVPLTTVQSGPKALLKRVIGRAPYGLAENARREDYNQLLRQAYRGREPIFDLASVESTRPDGTRETVSWKGRAVPALLADYALDDGHLNEAGQERAARAFLAVLAAARP
jgi:hypothetical protein